MFKLCRVGVTELQEPQVWSAFVKFVTFVIFVMPAPAPCHKYKRTRIGQKKNLGHSDSEAFK